MCSSASAVAVVAVAALVNGATPAAVAASFGDGFWSLITFTMQMVMVVISGYVVATSPPAAKLIDALAGVPRSGPRRRRRSSPRSACCPRSSTGA